jgi:phosphate transport system substrate-binding protein
VNEDKVAKYLFWGFVLLVIGALVAIQLYTRPGPPPEPPLTGAGSTFVAPLMIQWSGIYEKTEGGRKIDYRAFGSGDGIDWFIAGKARFACTDGPLTDQQLARARAAGGEVVHVPLVLGAVVPAYNLPKVTGPLRFTGDVLARIYMGEKYPGKEEDKILKWDHPALKELNPNAKLPGDDIVVVRRSDSSGTTYIWTDYLAKASAPWRSGPGVGLEVAWPAGVAASGNEGVAERVKQTPGAIGYVELTYAYRKDLAFGLVRNREGEDIRAGVGSIRAAADGLKEVPDDLRYSLTDAPGKGAYPICGTTWAVVRLSQPGAEGRHLVHFLYWATDEGQGLAEGLLYVPLPEALRERARRQIGRLKVEQ